MNKIDFLARFILPPYAETYTMGNNNETKPHGIPSAVLIPLLEENNEVFVVLTKRAEHLRKHAGQISFPGGKVEKSDKHLIETALRESYEEIGLAPKKVDVLGQLKNYETLTGYNISPIVGFIPDNTAFNIDSNEVAEVFKVPLRFFYQSKNYIEVPVIRKNLAYRVNFISYNNYTIWGATAAILKDLAKL